jgi:hypothetical protein
MQDVDDLIHVIVGRGVENSLRLAARLDQLVPPQPGQMLRQGGLAEPGQLLQFTDPFFAAQKLTEDQQPMRIAQALSFVAE